MKPGQTTAANMSAAEKLRALLSSKKQELTGKTEPKKEEGEGDVKPGAAAAEDESGMVDVKEEKAADKDADVKKEATEEDSKDIEKK